MLHDDHQSMDQNHDYFYVYLVFQQAVAHLYFQIQCMVLFPKKNKLKKFFYVI